MKGRTKAFVLDWWRALHVLMVVYEKGHYRLFHCYFHNVQCDAQVIIMVNVRCKRFFE